MSFLSLSVNEDWHPKVITTGPADGGLPAPLLRCPGFAGLDCFPFLLLSGFPPSPPLRKPQCPKEGSGPASTVRGLCSLSPLSLHPTLNLWVKDTEFKKKNLPLDQVLPMLLAFLHAVTFLEKIFLSYPISPFSPCSQTCILPSGEPKLCSVC